MKRQGKIFPNILELELQIKLLEYLKINKYINDDMYNYVIDKLITKIALCKNSNNNYKLLS